jgi:hypothetical protein
VRPAGRVSGQLKSPSNGHFLKPKIPHPES